MPTVDEDELARRRAFFELGDEDLRRLRALRPFAERHAVSIVDAFYDWLLKYPEAGAFFQDPATLGHVKQKQVQYFLGLFSGVCDLAYVENRLRVGKAHERVGLAPKWYIGAYARYLRLVYERLRGELADPEALAAAYRSIEKLVAFDIALAVDTYIAAHLETLARQQSAIRELSTPVIRVYERVLLLPLIGSIDSVRAQQIMQTVLRRVVDEHAQAVIIDIAGVATVDTGVANHLLDTTAAVRLLGAQTVLTGISPQVASTIVHLGVDISSMHTRNSLADGIQLALALAGRMIVAQPLRSS